MTPIHRALLCALLFVLSQSVAARPGIVMVDNQFPDRSAVYTTYCGNPSGCPRFSITLLQCAGGSCSVTQDGSDTSAHATLVGQVIAKVLSVGADNVTHFQLFAAAGPPDAAARWVTALVDGIPRSYDEEIGVVVTTQGTGAAAPSCAYRLVSSSTVAKLQEQDVVFVSAAGNQAMNGFTRKEFGPSVCNVSADGSQLSQGAADCSWGTVPVAQERASTIVAKSGVPAHLCPATEATASYNVRFLSNFLNEGSGYAGTTLAAGGCVYDLLAGGDGTSCGVTENQGTSFAAPFIAASVTSISSASWRYPSASYALARLRAAAQGRALTVVAPSASPVIGQTQYYGFVSWYDVWRARMCIATGRYCY
jgi:hypothetical protein